MSRVIAVDYGSKRVGIAISDHLRLTARPLEVVPRTHAVSRVAELAKELDVDTLVVGLPVGLSGGEGPSAAAARNMGAELAAATGLGVEYLDERFTTRLAEEALLESGMSRRRRRVTVDRVAAAILLQDYLDRRG